MCFGSVVEAIAFQAGRVPDKVCLIENSRNKECTYGQLWNTVLYFFNSLKVAGLQPEENVVIHTEQTINFLAAGLAVQLAGGVFVPIEKGISGRRIVEMLDYMESRFYIAAEPADYNEVFISINPNEEITGTVTAAEYIFPDPERPGTILFTTGTTGSSKGIVLSHRALLAGCNNHIEQMDCTGDDIMLMPQPLNHINGLRRTLGLLILGARVVIENGVIYLKQYFEALRLYHVTVLSLVPAYLNLLLNNASEDLKSFSSQLRAVAIGTAATPVPHQERLRNLLPDTRLFITYGATEAAGMCYYEYSSYSIKPFCVGGTCKGSSMSFVDDNMNPVNDTSMDKPGIFAFEGPSVMMGYWKEKDLSSRILRDGRLILADIGYRGEDGLLYILGRRDDVIITGGLKVSPTEVEDATLQMEDIRECACIAIPDSFLGQVPKLFVAMNAGAEFSREKILRHLGNTLERYKVPKAIEVVDEIPRTSGTNKIKRSELK